MMRLDTRRFACAAGASRLPAALPGPRGLGAALGTFQAPVREGQTFVFRGEQGVAAVSVLAPRSCGSASRPPALGRDHSYAVVQQGLRRPRGLVRDGR